MNTADTARFWAKVQKQADGCWLWKGRLGSDGGYGMFTLKGKALAAHRVAYRLTYGEFEPTLLVCHKCDVRPCVNPDHLFLGTHRDNVRDAIRKGRMKAPPHPNPPSGENHWKAKLTSEQVKEIREACLYAPKRSGLRKAAAIMFGVGQPQITEICAGRAWKGV